MQTVLIWLVIQLKLIIEFTEFDVDIAEVPQSVIDDIKNIEKKFNKWVYDKDNKLSWDRENRAFLFSRLQYNLERCTMKMNSAHLCPA